MSSIINYVDLPNLSAFWVHIKDYVDSKTAGNATDTNLEDIWDNINQLKEDVSTLQDTSGNAVVDITVSGSSDYINITESREGNNVTLSYDTTSLNDTLDAIPNYTINSYKISDNPVLNGEDINLGIIVDADEYPADLPITSAIDKLYTTVQSLGTVTKLSGVYAEGTSMHTISGKDGDFIIVGNNEYVYWSSATTGVDNTKWVLLGNTTDLGNRLKNVEDSYVASVTGTSGDYINISPSSASTGNVNLIIDDSGLSDALDNKVSKSGDTMSGGLGFNHTSYPHIYGNGTYLNLDYTNNGDGKGVTIDSTSFRKGSSATKSLGSTSNRWDGVYSTTGSFTGEVIGTSTFTGSNLVTTSDDRYKDYLEDIEIDYDKIKNIPKRRFNWKPDSGRKSNSCAKSEIGTSAQQLLNLYPELVYYNESTDEYSVDYQKLSIIALAAIDDLNDRIKILENKINE